MYRYIHIHIHIHIYIHIHIHIHVYIHIIHTYIYIYIDIYIYLIFIYGLDSCISLPTSRLSTFKPITLDFPRGPLRLALHLFPVSPRKGAVLPSPTWTGNPHHCCVTSPYVCVCCLKIG